MLRVFSIVGIAAGILVLVIAAIAVLFSIGRGPREPK
jgi:hypothetical protein